MFELEIMEKEFDIDMKRVNAMFESILSQSIIEMYDHDALFEASASSSLSEKFGDVIKTILDSIKKFFVSLKNAVKEFISKNKLKMKLKSLRNQVDEIRDIEYFDTKHGQKIYYEYLKKIDNLIREIKNASPDRINGLVNEYNKISEEYQVAFDLINESYTKESSGVSKSKKSAEVVINELDHDIDHMNNDLSDLEDATNKTIQNANAAVTTDTQITKVSLLKKVSMGVSKSVNGMAKWVFHHPATILALMISGGMVVQHKIDKKKFAAEKEELEHKYQKKTHKIVSKLHEEQQKNMEKDVTIKTLSAVNKNRKQQISKLQKDVGNTREDLDNHKENVKKEYQTKVNDINAKLKKHQEMLENPKKFKNLYNGLSEKEFVDKVSNNMKKGQEKKNNLLIEYRNLSGK